MNEQKQPQEGKLTAEDMYDESSLYGVRDKVVSLMQQYAAQQTASLSERVKELEKYNENAILRVDSLTILADGFRKESAALREELKEETIQKINGLMEIKELKDELEAVKTEHQYKSENITEALKQLADYENRLEAVKKENAEWKARNLEYSYKVAIQSCVMFKDQRDEAVKLLDRARFIIDRLERKNPIVKDIKDFQDRLSSGETKPTGYCEVSCKWEPFGGGAKCKKCGSVSPF